MPAAKTSSPALICGDDEFAVKQHARQLYQQWCDEIGGMDHEMIEATVANSGEALAALARLREALQTLPFFGTGKVIWLRDCNFLGDERAASAQAVTEALGDLAEELKNFAWSRNSGIRLLISAGKVDKRKTFFKTLDKIGSVESFAGWSADDRDWAERAEVAARTAVRERKKEISEEALAELVSRVGPQSAAARQRGGEAVLVRRRPASRLKPATSTRFACGTRRPGPLRWATPWATAICPVCCGGWTRNCGK